VAAEVVMNSEIVVAVMAMNSEMAMTVVVMNSEMVVVVMNSAILVVLAVEVAKDTDLQERLPNTVVIATQ
jgi:hypothetical protein